MDLDLLRYTLQFFYEEYQFPYGPIDEHGNRPPIYSRYCEALRSATVSAKRQNLPIEPLIALLREGGDERQTIGNAIDVLERLAIDEDAIMEAAAIRDATRFELDTSALDNLAATNSAHGVFRADSTPIALWPGPADAEDTNAAISSLAIGLVVEIAQLPDFPLAVCPGKKTSADLTLAPPDHNDPDGPTPDKQRWRSELAKATVKLLDKGIDKIDVLTGRVPGLSADNARKIKSRWKQNKIEKCDGT